VERLGRTVISDLTDGVDARIGGVIERANRNHHHRRLARIDIAAIHARSRQTYGAPRVHAELRICGQRHSRKRIARLMRRAGIAGRVPKRYRHTTVGDPFTALPDLVQRDFAPTHPDELWVGDITYVRT
jgi:transposase InsO family protein